MRKLSEKQERIRAVHQVKMVTRKNTFKRRMGTMGPAPEQRGLYLQTNPAILNLEQGSHRMRDGEVVVDAVEEFDDGDYDMWDREEEEDTVERFDADLPLEGFDDDLPPQYPGAYPLLASIDLRMILLENMDSDEFHVCKTATKHGCNPNYECYTQDKTSRYHQPRDSTNLPKDFDRKYSLPLKSQEQKENLQEHVKQFPEQQTSIRQDLNGGTDGNKNN